MVGHVTAWCQEMMAALLMMKSRPEERGHNQMTALHSAAR